MESIAPALAVEEYISPAPAVSHVAVPVVEYFSPAPAVPAERTVPFVDRGVVYHSGTCAFLIVEDYRWRSRASEQMVGCWRTTLSMDSCFDLVKADGPGVGTTPSSLMGQATIAMRCGSRRRSWLAGFMRSGRAKGPCSAAPHDVSSILYSKVVFFLGMQVVWEVLGQGC